jgi:O-methyltransferase
MNISNWMRKKRLKKSNLLWPFYRPLISRWMLVPYYTSKQRYSICKNGDPIRFGAIKLALDQILKDEISGSLAECGVHKGTLSKFIHEHLPDRPLYLFDTFQGFDTRDSDTASDNRFKDTSADDVLDYIGDDKNVIVKKGYFPDTAIGLQDAKFAFVMIDFDKYEPTLSALEFFYSRICPGGFVFIHDYNSSESNWACKRALDGFLKDKPEKIIAIPDASGSVIFRKI